MIKKIKNIFLSLSILAAITPMIANADLPKTLYGYDDRHESLQYYDQLYVDQARSVGGIVYSSKLINTPHENEYFAYEKILAIRNYNLCPGERFGYQPVLARCTAFLIADDLMLTAGHCINTQEECQNMSVVFDNFLENELIKKRDVFRCVELVAHRLQETLFNKYDYSIFRLDRKTSRRPLTIGSSMKIKEQTHILTIGHPLGLPMKTTDGAQISQKKNSYFITNLDVYGGNSGSPVFDQESGKVIGLVSYGQEDWTTAIDPATGFACRRSNHYSDSSKDGERIFRLDRIRSLKNIINM